MLMIWHRFTQYLNMNNKILSIQTIEVIYKC